MSGARPVRDAFDVDAVSAWLSERVPEVSGVPEVTQFTGGASNLTYLLRWPDRELILRRPPPGTKAKGAHDMAREYRLQDALKPVYPVVPSMVALCEDPDVLGSDFYVMEKVAGLIPRKEMPKGLELTEAQTRRLCIDFLDQLVALHRVDTTAAGLDDFGKGAGYVGRQIEGWCHRYTQARTWNVPAWTPVMDWLREHQPDDVGTCLIHNDFRFDNVVLDADDPGRIVGVLDWELATRGDPLMDLGSSLAYWVEAGDDPIGRAIRRQPTHLPGMLTRQEVVAHYLDRSGLQPDDVRFYVVYGVFRLAGIVQQIYLRYHKGQTKNPAFRTFWAVNHYLRWRAGRAMRGVI